MNEQRLALNRRRFLECFSAAGMVLMPGALLAVAQDSTRITLEMLQSAEKIAALFSQPKSAVRFLRVSVAARVRY